MNPSLASKVVLACALASVGCCHPNDCSRSTFNSLLKLIPDASLNYVSQVPQNGSFGDAATNIPFPQNATHLPELCAASINVKTPGNTSYNFGVFLPTQWNGRFLATGNGGFGGGINWIDMVSRAPLKTSILSKSNN